MDGGRFDRLTRALGERLPRRRAAGLISTLAAGLGVGLLPGPDDVDAKKGGKNKKKKNKHKGQFRCDPTGKWVNKCVGGQILILTDDDCRCECPEGTIFEPRCNLCLANNNSQCCPNEKKCYGSCIPKNQCCLEFDRECTGTAKTCVPLGTCCPGEEACPIAENGCCNTLAGEECAPFDGCCNTLLGKYICDGKYCCEENEECCPGLGCRAAETSCCPVACPSDPAGCCPDGQVCTTLHGCCNPANVCGNKCCTGGRSCTVGTYLGSPRTACCGGPERPEGEFGCDGVCCAAGCGLCCNFDSFNPCLCC